MASLVELIVPLPLYEVLTITWFSIVIVLPDITAETFPPIILSREDMMILLRVVSLSVIVWVFCNEKKSGLQSSATSQSAINLSRASIQEPSF